MAGDLEYYGIAPSEQREVEFRVTQTATGGQTAFTGLTYTVGYLDGWRDGVKMDETEFTATNGTSATVSAPAIAGEKFHWQARRQVPVIDVYTKAETAAIADNFFGVATGTGDAAVLATAITTGFTLADGVQVKVRWPGINTVTNPVINVNATGNRTITTSEGYLVPVGALTPNKEVVLQYNSSATRFEAINVNFSDYSRSAGLKNLLYPSSDGHWRDIYRSGWKPSGFNQQWGGAQWGAEMLDATTGNTYKFDVATGQVQDDNFAPFGHVGTSGYITGQGFKVPETITPTEIWLKLYKVGNPTDNIRVDIYADSGGSPSTLISALTSISGKAITSKTDGEWYRITGTIASLTAGTQYHVIAYRSSGSPDASNYYAAKQTLVKKYPFGFRNTGTNVPVWTQDTGYALCFVIPNPTSTSFLRSGGQFGQKLVFAEGNQVTQSKSLTQPLVNFFDGKNFTYLARVASAEKGKPISDFLYGLDNERIQIMCNSTTGYAAVNFYNAAGTLVTLTSAIDISTSSSHDVTVIGRFEGDGADYLQLWVNGVMRDSTSAQTYTLSSNLRNSGTAWIGGGFPVAPTWTQNMQMTSLPSAQGWTWTGTATESSAMSIQNNMLVQNKNGYAAAASGYYARTVTLNNTTGWTYEITARVSSMVAGGMTTNTPMIFQVFDGTKYVAVIVTETYVQTGTGGTAVDFTVHGDFKTKAHTFRLCGQGSNYLLYIDGKLAVDGTGKLSFATATNSISFGDTNSASAENADVIWHSVKYYSGGMLTHQAPTGMELYEAAYFTGNKGSILPALYGNGSTSMVSVKEFCGVEKNHVEEPAWIEYATGVTANPSTTSTTYVLVPEMELYSISDTAHVEGNNNLYLSGATAMFLQIFADGAQMGVVSRFDTAAGSPTFSNQVSLSHRGQLGLHKYEVRYSTAAGTLTSNQNFRDLKVRNK